MSVTVNLKKIVIVVGVLLIAGGLVYWFVSTKDERAVKAELEILVKFAQRQALEIAIIEQRSKLLNYQQQMAQQRIAQPIRPTLPFIPADPDNVTEKGE